MESNVNKLSMREIIGQVGFPITINEFRNTYKFNVNLDTAMKFENNLKEISQISEIEQIIREYEDIFDKEIYVFHIARLLEKDIEAMKRAELLSQENVEQYVFTNDVTGKNKRRFFVNAKNLLKKCDVVDIVMKKKSKGEFEIYSSRDFIEQSDVFSDNMKINALKKLEKIEEKIGLSNVLIHLKNTDLNNICRYPNLAILLIVSQDKLERKIRKYIQYIDLDKMLILANAIYFYKYGEEFYKFSKEEASELKRFTMAVSEIVGENIKPLKSERFYFTVDYNEIKIKVNDLVTEEIAEVSKEIVEEADVEVIEETVEEQLEEIAEVSEDVVKETENEVIKETVEERLEEKVDDKKESINQYINNFINCKNKIIMDFENRKNTILKLDENYVQEDLDDGTTIFSLPNKGCYIIETIRNKENFSGNATYIIDKELFEKQKNRIIENQNLNLNELAILKLENSKSVTKLVYTGWENSIDIFFNMKTQEKYTEEEKTIINKLLEKVKK